VPLQAGDQVRVITSGGGGYGDPLRRDPQAVARDVRLGYVSAAAARETYGVVLDADGAVRPADTEALRHSRSAGRSTASGSP
jgi:N-methylhydantoinase B